MILKNKIMEHVKSAVPVMLKMMEQMEKILSAEKILRCRISIGNESHSA